SRFIERCERRGDEPFAVRRAEEHKAAFFRSFRRMRDIYRQKPCGFLEAQRFDIFSSYFEGIAIFLEQSRVPGAARKGFKRKGTRAAEGIQYMGACYRIADFLAPIVMLKNVEKRLPYAIQHRPCGFAGRRMQFAPR